MVADDGFQPLNTDTHVVHQIFQRAMQSERSAESIQFDEEVCESKRS